MSPGATLTLKGVVLQALVDYGKDLLLIGLGLGLTYLGTTRGADFGDGATVGAGAMLIGAGARGLLGSK